MKFGDLGKMLAELPPPHATYHAPHAVFEIYRAKDLHRSKWNGPALRELVALCRLSYSRYGKRPLFDAYDGKAAIYLVRAIYSATAGDHHEEWLSVRMVPGDKKPIGVAEPEIHMSNGKRVDYWMKKKIGAEHFWEQVASSSRMCGIHPYLLRKNGTGSFLEDDSHKFTPVCFALIHKQFVIDYPLSRFPYRYITATVRTDFYETKLAYRAGKRMVRPTHVAAHTFLGVERNSIHVDRDVYSYPFPLYWFDRTKLLKLVNGLREKEHKKPFEKLTSAMFANLTKKAKKPIPIAGVNIEPAKMRALIDRFVPDAPELKITNAKQWYRGMDSVLRAAKVI